MRAERQRYPYRDKSLKKEEVRFREKKRVRFREKERVRGIESEIGIEICERESEIQRKRSSDIGSKNDQIKR